MEITILGSGKMTLTKKRGASAYLVKIDKNYLLLDCGHGTFRKLTAECKKYYSGKILVAKDFMKIKI